MSGRLHPESCQRIRLTDRLVRPTGEIKSSEEEASCLHDCCRIPNSPPTPRPPLHAMFDILHQAGHPGDSTEFKAGQPSSSSTGPHKATEGEIAKYAGEDTTQTPPPALHSRKPRAARRRRCYSFLRRYSPRQADHSEEGPLPPLGKTAVKL